MDVNHTHGTHRAQAHERYREAMAELVRRTRGKVEDARNAADAAGERSETRRAEAQKLAHPHAERRIHNARVDAAQEDRLPVDRVEISNAALGRAEPEGEARDRAKVALLKQAYRTGRLHTPERMERAAESLLRGVHRAAPEAPGGVTGADVPNDGIARPDLAG